MDSVKEKQAMAFESLKGKFGYTNVFASPRLVKIVVSSGIGSVKEKDRKKPELIAERLARITGQKPATRLSKKSIATFRLRQGEPVGYQITLRGARMYGFLDKLLTIAIPRTRDFRGLTANSIDSVGNYTLGIKDHTIFPETGDEELKDVFGLAVTIVTSSNNKEETKAFLDLLGFPFKKDEVLKK